MVPRFTRPLTKRLVKDERPAIRAVCAILDAFHFGSPAGGLQPAAAAQPVSPTAPKDTGAMVSESAAGAAALVGGTSEAQSLVSCLWRLLTELLALLGTDASK